MNKDIFSKRLKYARKILRKLTQKELAEKMGIHYTSIIYWENKKYSTLPPLSNLMKLANALEVTIQYFMGDPQNDFNWNPSNKLWYDIASLSDKDQAFIKSIIKYLIEKQK